MDVGLECGFEGVCVVVLVVGFDVVFEIHMEVGLGVGLVDVADWTTSDLSVFCRSRLIFHPTPLLLLAHNHAGFFMSSGSGSQLAGSGAHHRLRLHRSSLQGRIFIEDMQQSMPLTIGSVGCQIHARRDLCAFQRWQLDESDL